MSGREGRVRSRVQWGLHDNALLACDSNERAAGLGASVAYSRCVMSVHHVGPLRHVLSHDISHRACGTNGARA